MSDLERYEIKEGVYLLKSDEEDFHRNIYLRVFSRKGEKVSILIDPGTKLDMPALLQHLKELIGGVQHLDLIFLSHQDPDVSSNLSALLASAPRAVVIASVDTWRLVRMYGIDQRRFKAVEEFRTDRLRIKKTGHMIQLVPAYFCHFRGAMMLYDIESRVLFSGDFMSGVNTKEGKGIFAREDSWEGIHLFHQIYMPSTAALRETIGRIGMLNPLPEIIAPQHGDLVEGELVMDFLNRLAELPVGMDFLLSIQPEKDRILLSINEFLEQLRESRPQVFRLLLDELRRPDSFTSPFVFTGEAVTDLKLSTRGAVLYLWRVLQRLVPERDAQEIKVSLVEALDRHDLEIPPELAETREYIDLSGLIED